MANLTKWHIYGFVPPMGNTKVSHCATQWNILAFHLWLQHQVLVLNEFHTQVLKYFFQPLTSWRLSEAVPCKPWNSIPSCGGTNEKCHYQIAIWFTWGSIQWQNSKVHWDLSSGYFGKEKLSSIQLFCIWIKTDFDISKGLFPMAKTGVIRKR